MKIKKIVERLAWKIAFLLPKKIVYFATIRLIAHATQGKYGNTLVPELPAMEAVARWSKDYWGWS